MGKGVFKKIYILQTDLERKKFLQGNNLLIKTPTLEKISFLAYNVGKKNLNPLYVRKKNLSLEVWEKTNSYTNRITHSHPSPHPLKSQMVGPLGIDKEPLKKRVPFGE